jgi:transposase
VVTSNYSHFSGGSGALFPRIIKEQRKNTTYEYLVISESVRLNSKTSTTRNIARLGNVKKFKKCDIENIIDGFIKLFQVEKYGLTNEIRIVESLEYGSIIFWRKIWNMLGLSSMIRKHIRLKERRVKISAEKYIEQMVINRCIEPLSKLGGSRWIERTCYKKMKGYSDLSLHIENFYRSMDYLIGIKDELERSLFDKLSSLFSINVKLTFYDITSTFFYSDSCPLSAHGHSRDDQPDKVQIVVGVVTSWEGYPIKHYVFEGNTKDESTVCEVVKDLKNTYNIEQTTFVGDRGMITKLNLGEIESSGFDYIMGVKHRQNEITGMLFRNQKVKNEDYTKYKDLFIQDKMVPVKDFLLWKSMYILENNKITFDKSSLAALEKYISQLTNEDDITYAAIKPILEDLIQDNKIRRKVFDPIKKYQGQYDNELRLIVCLNKERKALTKRTRDKRLASLSKELDKLCSSDMKGKKKTDAVKMEQKLATIFEGYKRRFKKFFDIHRDKKRQKIIGYALNSVVLKEEEEHDGIFILTTNRSDFNAEKIIDSYKNLREIEILFDDLKHFVYIRPVRHWIENRVRAHVFTCILSLLLKRIFEINYMKGKAVMEPLEEISKSKLVYYRVKFSEREQRYQIIPKVTDLSSKQKKYFKMVGIHNPMSLENYMW